MVMKIFLYDADSTADIVLLPFIYVVIVIITAHCTALYCIELHNHIALH